MNITIINENKAVRMADFNIAAAPASLSTDGIGSCVVVCLFDTQTRLGGLAHVMLPRNMGNDKSQTGKCADTAIVALIQLMSNNGATKSNLVAKIIGGACVLPSEQPPTITIGKDNIDAIERILANQGIPIAARDIGGNTGRCLVFHPATGVVEVTILAQGRVTRI